MGEGSPSRALDSASVTVSPTGVLPPSAVAEQRQRFSVELRAGETTIVSWKKLTKESGRVPVPPSSVPVPPGVELELRGDTDIAVQSCKGELIDAAPQHRFSAVIEKIERLYMGKQSSDEEELDDVPDDDQYDTEDSFIDDAELDEYFQVENSATKHSGYFVNKGKLERVEPVSSPKLLQPKGRKKREKIGEQMIKDPTLAGNMRIKDAARNAALVRRKKASPSTVMAPIGEHFDEGRHMKDKNTASTTSYKKKSVDFNYDIENMTYAKPSSKDTLSFLTETKEFERQKAADITFRDLPHKSRVAVESFDAMYQAPQERAVISHTDSRSKKILNGESEMELPSKVKRMERNGTTEYMVMNSSAMHPQLATHSSSMKLKEVSSGKSKGTRLERAICDLEKFVALCRPQELPVQEMDPLYQSGKRRLPREVKLKLAKVANLSASQYKISEDIIIDRLMGILGHLVQRKTLKRNMKEMVESGLSAKQQKVDRFQQIKKDVNEMIRGRIGLSKSKVSEHQDGSANDFHQASGGIERSVSKGKFVMDKVLEDKICELYDLYVEGMDEEKGPQSRKLYVELAELWPNGYMDNVGIRSAIFRSKERKRALYNRSKAREEERIKRKRLASASGPDAAPTPCAQAPHERPSAGSSSSIGQVIFPNQPHGGVTPARGAPHTAPPNDPTYAAGPKQHDKIRGAPEGDNGVRKKMKRRVESDLADLNPHPAKLTHFDSKERGKPPPRPHTEEAANTGGGFTKQSLQVIHPPGCDPPSGS